MKRVVTGILLCVALAVAPAAAQAATITYTSVLTRHVPTIGVNTQPDFSSNDPLGATFYSFAAQQNVPVTVRVNRLNVAFDPVAWIFRGLFTDTTQFGLNELFDVSDTNFVAFFDDNNPPAIPNGPFGDPFGIFTPTATGVYTIAITNGISDFSTQPNTFSVAFSTVPEPSTMSMMAMGVIGLMVYGRHRARRVTY
jgi:hypothetical protein